MGALGDLALGPPLVGQHTSNVSSGSRNSGWTPTARQPQLHGLSKDLHGDALGLTGQGELVDELGDVACGVDGGNTGFELPKEETVVSAPLLLCDVCSGSDLLESADDVALAARHVYGSCRNALDGPATDEALPDDLPVYDGGSLKDVLGKVELVGDLGKLGEREGQVPLRGA